MTTATTAPAEAETAATERALTGAEKDKKDEIFQALDPKEFEKRYGKDDAERVMHAVATKGAKGNAESAQPTESSEVGETRTRKVPEPKPAIVPGAPFALAKHPAVFAGVVEAVHHDAGIADVKLRASVLKEGADANVSRSLPLKSIQPLSVRGILDSLNAPLESDLMPGFARGTPVAAATEPGFQLGRVWESNGTTTSVALDFSIAESNGSTMLECPTANLVEFGPADAGPAEASDDAGAEAAADAASSAAGNGSVIEAGSGSQLVVFKAKENSASEGYKRGIEKMGDAIIDYADAIEEHVKTSLNINLAGSGVQVMPADDGFKLYAGLTGTPQEINDQANRIAEAIKTEFMPDMTYGNTDVSVDWEYSYDNKEMHDHIFAGESAALNSSNNNNDAGTQFACMHENKGTAIIAEAATAYEAALKAAGHWNLRSPAGIEVVRVASKEKTQ